MDQLHLLSPQELRELQACDREELPGRILLLNRTTHCGHRLDAIALTVQLLGSRATAVPLQGATMPPSGSIVLDSRFVGSGKNERVAAR